MGQARAKAVDDLAELLSACDVEGWKVTKVHYPHDERVPYSGTYATVSLKDTHGDAWRVSLLTGHQANDHGEVLVWCCAPGTALTRARAIKSYRVEQAIAVIMAGQPCIEEKHGRIVAQVVAEAFSAGMTGVERGPERVSDCSGSTRVAMTTPGGKRMCISIDTVLDPSWCYVCPHAPTEQPDQMPGHTPATAVQAILDRLGEKRAVVEPSTVKASRSAASVRWTGHEFPEPMGA